LVVLLVVAPSPCFAVRELVPVSKERAKELGVEIRSHAAGSGRVWLALEFKAEGEFKEFSHVQLDIAELVSYVILSGKRSSSGSVVVGFYANPANLDKITLSVVIGSSPMVYMCQYQLRVKDFVELDKRLTKKGKQEKKAPQNAAEQGGAGPPAANRSESK